MRTSLVSRRTGVSLAELVLCLVILAAVAATAAPKLGRARDEYAVRAARDAAAGLVDRARLLAQLRGSARLEVDAAAAELRVESPIGAPAGVVLRPGADFGATVAVSGGAPAGLSLDFDARGLGRLVNRTVRFRRGESEAGLTLSSFGRVRRW